MNNNVFRPLQAQQASRPLKITVQVEGQEDHLGSLLSKVVMKLFALRTAAHIVHLKVKGDNSYSAHIALNELYDGLPDLADGLVECYQGATEKLLDLSESVDINASSVEEIISIIRCVSDFMTSVQGECEISELNSDIDAVKSFLNKIRYKLIFLK
jgi:DNA-binding ferritin-like protein